MNKGDHLEPQHHVLRYVKRSHVDKTEPKIATEAFLCKPGEPSASVDWIERFPPPIQNQCDRIWDEKRLTYRKGDKLARLNVDVARRKVLEKKITLFFIYDPLDPDDTHPKPQTSHTLIHGMPEIETPAGQMVGALLREIVTAQDIFDCKPG